MTDTPPPPLLDLFMDGRFDDYLAAVRRGVKTWLFVHVPKTAGSSLSQEISSELQPYYNIHIDHTDLSTPAADRFDIAVDRFLAAAQQKTYLSASGHILHKHVQTIRKALPGVRAFTLLREPLSRLISDYNYQRSPQHPLHEQVKARVPDFMAFVEQPGPQNRISRHLVPMAMIRHDRFDDAIAHVMRSLAFVGVQERYDLYFRMLTLIAFGTARSPVEKRRVAEKAAPTELTPDQLARVRDLNRMDFAIYDAVQQRLAPMEAALTQWLDDRAPIA